MSRGPSATDLLEAARPGHDPGAYDPEGPRGRDTLERIVTTPRRTPLPASRRARLHRRTAPALALCVIAVIIAITAVPAVRGGSDVLGDVAEAAEALGAPGGIYHFKIRRSNADGFYGSMEVWHTADARRTRIVHDDSGLETVMDYDRKLQASFNPELNRLVHIVYDGQWDRPPDYTDAPVMPSTENLTGLVRTLERARNGAEDVRLVGDTVIRGIPVHELRFDFRHGLADITRTVYVDRERHLPVRVVDGPIVDDFYAIERLPRTAANERLTTMGPHPGARLVVEDDF